VDNNIHTDKSDSSAIFSLDVYRSKNQDLQNLNDEELKQHFSSYGFKERRPYEVTNTTTDRLSMKYLRGEGIEIGAGGHPVRLYGDAVCLYADIAEDTVFDSGKNIKKILYDINNPVKLDKSFDFVIACHVLEHVDSLAAALSAISKLLQKDGIAYIILPNLESDADQFWMPKFGRVHHLIEMYLPGIFRRQHERDFCRGMTDIDPATGWGPVQQKFPEKLRQDILKGKVTPQYRYIYHRHSYSFLNWTTLLVFLIKFFNFKMTLIDSSSGDERSDCHFIFKKS
jgi:SAM-dependent methyltransferase